MNTVAHHYDHADIVRKSAVELGKSEGLADRELFLLEIAGLWHDIGRDYVENQSQHAAKAASMFLDTFPREDEFSTIEKDEIVFMITYHDKYQQALDVSQNDKLLLMLRIIIDADTLELLGERGYMRAVETAETCAWPKYDEDNPYGETYGFNDKQFDERFKLKRVGKLVSVIEPTLVGQLNFQISCTELLFTEAAKSKGKDGAEYLKAKIEEIVSVK